MSSAITVYLLDDDEVFLERLRTFVDNYMNADSPYGYRLRCFSAAAPMLEAAKTDAPVLLLSDIKLKEAESGIVYADSLRKAVPGCRIIYLSSYLQYAPEIFDTDPLYFILKDEYETRLPAALKKFFAVYQQTHGSIEVTSENKHVIIPWNTIRYCEHSGKSTLILTQNGSYSVRCGITQLLELLPADQFAMCHKSFIVNLAYIRSVTRLKLTLEDGTVLNISRNCCDEFRKAHSRWISGML